MDRRVKPGDDRKNEERLPRQRFALRYAAVSRAQHDLAEIRRLRFQRANPDFCL
jgi:hypothetical protein